MKCFESIFQVDPQIDADCSGFCKKYLFCKLPEKRNPNDNGQKIYPELKPDPYHTGIVENSRPPRLRQSPSFLPSPSTRRK